MRNLLLLSFRILMLPKLKSKLSILLLLSVCIGNAEALETKFCGRSLKQKSIEKIHVPCPKDSVCFGGWSHWEIQIDRILEGDEVPSRVIAAAFQSANYTPVYEASLRLFTIERIEDAEKRKLLGAEFLLIRWSKDSVPQSCGKFASDG